MTDPFQQSMKQEILIRLYKKLVDLKHINLNIELFFIEHRKKYIYLMNFLFCYIFLLDCELFSPIFRELYPISLDTILSSLL